MRSRMILAVVIATLSGAVYAQWTPGTRVTSQLHNLSSNGGVEIDPSANSTILQGHFAPGTAVTTLSESLSGWKSIYLYSDASVNCCATFDASNPITTSGGKCTKGTPLKAGAEVSRDYGLPYPVRMACSAATDAATGADIAYEIVK